MTVQNDFLPFAGGAGANVMPQATYASLPARTGGFTAGVANSAALNKAWRQSSIMASVVAQLIADTAGANVVDDGTIATIETNLIAAIKVLAGQVASSQIGNLHLGAAAQEGIGQGLEDDGAGNLRVKVADTSLRRTAAGMQSNDPVTTVAGNVALLAANHGSTLLTTGTAPTITAPATSGLWNGYNVTVIAQGGPVTFTPNAADKVNGGAVGGAFTILQSQTAFLVTDGAGNWWPMFQSTPQGAYSPRYVTSAQTLGAGTYSVDTSGGTFTVTLPAGPAVGATLELSDVAGTWGAYPLTVARNGATILGSASDLVCDVSGETFKIWYNGSDWRLF